MGSTTPNLGLPYPGLNQNPNIPADIQALAAAVDNVSAVVGPGSVTNTASSGGANRTAGLPFIWTDSVVVTTSVGSGWSFTTSGQTFVGVGNFHVTPGAETNGLHSLQCNQPSITSGNVTLSGIAFDWNGSAVVAITSGQLIRINITILGW